MKPEILVFDEPTTALDPPAQRNLAGLMRRLGHVKIVSTHDAAFARAVGTRAVFFERGRVAGEGTVDEVLQRFDWEAHLGQ
jgi:ABC-type polar amino acid transport system ATPase subunit